MSKYKKLHYINDIPPPAPGMYHFNLDYEEDLRQFDSSYEDITPKELFTDIIDAADINLFSMVLESIRGNKKDKNTKETVPWLRKSQYISSEYFKSQEARSEVLKRLKTKEASLKNIDYEKNILNSFKSIDSPIKYPFEVEQEYSFIPSTINNDIKMLIIDREVLKMDMMEENCKIIIYDNNDVVLGEEGKKYASGFVDYNEYLLVELDENTGNAYYKDINYVIKVKEKKITKEHAE
ncbi:hypothetical protein TCON_2538 [Astathelohania contejeani]|uniref:Uncharacterized protein n=1 Tax=Astathelohania contejeani TaxID=164912 RepID=A0ABQ7HVQ8_9MICR|nr:hypothetical protein TCON_2538 [Thelohania contejeani]